MKRHAPSKVRHFLESYEGKRLTMQTKVIKFSQSRAICSSTGIQPTVLLKDVTLQNGLFICDHIWLNSKDISFISKELSRDSLICFTGTVYRYCHELLRKVRYNYSLKDIEIFQVSNQATFA